MKNNMDDTDLEAFNKFIEKHWGNMKTQTVQEVNASSEESEEQPKRRGRKPKTAQEI